MEDLCLHCDIPKRDYDPSDPDCFACSDCACYRCKYVHCCAGQCVGGGADMSEYVERGAAIKALMNDAPEQVGYSREDAADCICHMDAADVECCGRLRGVTYEDGKVTAVYIRDTDDAVKVFTEVRHGRWIDKGEYAVCMECGGRSGTQYDGVELIPLMTQFCPNCGAKMDGGDD